MATNLNLMLLLFTVFVGAGLATPPAVQAQTSEVPPDTLVVTSVPPGAAAAVWVDAADGQELTNTGINGTTPWQVKLKNNKNCRYFIEISKEGYEPVTKQVDMEEVAVEGVGKRRKTAAAALGLAGQAAGIFSKDSRIPDGLDLGSKVMETDVSGGGARLKFSPNPVHVVLKRTAPGAPPPAPSAAAPPQAGAETTPATAQPPAATPAASQSQTIQAYEIACLFSSLVLDDKIVLGEVQRPVAVKFGPAGEILVMQGEPKKLRCASLVSDLQEKGMRVSFSKGLLYLGDFTFSFEEGSYILSRRPGELVGCGIKILDDEKEVKDKGKARKNKRESKKRVDLAPNEEDND